LWNKNKDICIVANGEIYNYLELKHDLQLKGHSFSTESDIEVIINLYEEYGIDFASHLRGMFAFALVDKKKNLLILGRDRMGEKPLFVAESASGFSFSSELRTLVQAGIVPLVFDPKALPNYFLYGFVPEPFTFIKGIQKVAAGTLEIFSFSNNERSVHTYWTMESTEPSQSLDPSQELRDLLGEVGELIVRSDVPIGISLSGGLDSSIIASIVNAHVKDLHSFTVGYTGSHSSDESADAIKIAKSLGITPHVVKLDSNDIASRFEQVCLLRDEPVADIAGPSYLAVAELAHSQGIKVLLNGQGADELFWGYPWVRNVAFTSERRAKTLSGYFKIREYIQFNPLPKAKGALLEWIKDFGGLKENLMQLREDVEERKLLGIGILVYERRPRARKIKKISLSLCTSPAFFVPAHNQNPLNKKGSSDQVLKVLAQTFLRSNGLGQTDRLSMAASVESRTPFVDHKIVEFSIRENSKSNSYYLRPKSLLIAAVRELIPLELINQPKKGFTPPVRDWYKAIYLRHKEDFAKPRIVEIGLVTQRATAILNKPLSQIGRPSLLWLELAVLELWVRGLEQDQRK
jgi:asparagine synthase (glutamine-hydrolysing)